MPTFTYHKGKLRSVDEACSSCLWEPGLNIDHLVVLPFKGRNDDRERRSLVQTAKICVSLDESAGKAATEMWRSRMVFRHPLLEEAELPPSKEMIYIEDVDETALPSTTNDTLHPSQAEKAQQCGVHNLKGPGTS